MYMENSQNVVLLDLPVYGLLTDESKLQSYIMNALPMLVRALKSQRGLGMWEIINEPEGCVIPGKIVARQCPYSRGFSFSLVRDERPQPGNTKYGQHNT